eukprot:487553_1
MLVTNKIMKHSNSILIWIVCLCLCLAAKKIKILSSMTICLKSSEVSQKYLSKLLANIDNNYEIYLLRPTCCNETIKYNDIKENNIHLIEYNSIAPYTDFRKRFNTYDVDGWVDLVAHNCRNILSNKTIINELKQISFDLSIVQLWDACGFIISDLLHLKRIDFVIQGLMYPQANKIYDFIYYDSFKNKIIPESGSDKTFEILLYFPVFDQIRVDFNIPIKTQLDSFKIQTQFVWIPQIPGFEYPNYLVPRIQFIGPIRSQMQLDSGSINLNSDLDCIKWLNSLPSNAKVIYFTFGTLWLNMTQLKHRDLTLMKSLNTILSSDDKPYTNYYIIMTCLKSSMYFTHEIEVLMMKQYNDKIRIYNKWIPQTQILNHPRVKVIVLHGGIGTVQEAMFCGVPMVGIPFEYDQPLNMEKAERIGIAYPMLNVSSFTVQQLINAIDNVMLNDYYLKRINIWSKAMKIYDGTPLMKWSIYCVVNNISDLMHLPLNSIKLKMKEETNGNNTKYGNRNLILLVLSTSVCIVLSVLLCTSRKKSMKKIHSS